MATALKVVKAEDSRLKKKRERIDLIETLPREDWFVRSKTSRGRVVWYVRFVMTGMNPRLYGPFPSKHQGVLFLDNALDALADGISEIDTTCSERMVKEACQKIWPPIVEYPILTSLHSMCDVREKLHTNARDQHAPSAIAGHRIKVHSKTKTASGPAKRK